jgi:hypothetical protein
MIMTTQQSPCPVIYPPPLAFECQPECTRDVRRYVRSRVIEGGRPDLVEESVTVASELFGNAVRAQVWQGIAAEISVQCCVQGTAVLIDCYDRAAGWPELLDIDPVAAESGRGLHIVDSITRGQWGWQPWAAGKVVSAMITDPPPG